MHITDYQMHNVLKVYTRQLSRKRSSAQPRKANARTPGNSIRISTRDRRQSVIDKVAKDIVERITNSDDNAKTNAQRIIEKMRDSEKIKS